MVCEPAKWSENSYGGYLENKFNKIDLITGSIYHNHKIENKANLYNAVNYINKTKFKINIDLLKYLYDEGGGGKAKYLLDLENDTNDIQKAITLKIAKLYSNITFYLNVNSDWRGRIYTRSFFLTYHGGDFSTSLIEFNEGEKLTENGLNYLYLFGANCHDEDNLGKLSFNYYKIIIMIK